MGSHEHTPDPRSPYIHANSKAGFSWLLSSSCSTAHESTICMAMTCLAGSWPEWANQHWASELDWLPTTWLCPVKQAFDQRTTSVRRARQAGRLTWKSVSQLGSPVEWSARLGSYPHRAKWKHLRGWRSHSQLWIPGAGKYRAVLVKCDLKIGGTVGRSAPKSRQDVLWRHIGCWTWFGRYPWIPQGLKHNTVQAWSYWMHWSGYHRFINTCWFTLNDLISSENRTYLHNKVISLCSPLVW